MHKKFIIIGAISSMLSVVVGAFSAHALKTTLEATQRLETFETAVKYQFYHSLGLILLGLLMLQFQHKTFTVSGYGFIIGIIVFSGSLYALSITGYTILGAITPMGGLAFIIGWGAFAWGVYRAL
jgi:uncharacterized membrane protein YgdD (TMEM256/DUF423 family)